MAFRENKPLARCLGEFVGHIIHSVKRDSKIHEIDRRVDEKTNGNVTLRRTTIDEIEIRSEETDRD